MKIATLAFLAVSLIAHVAQAGDVKEPDLAGSWYTASKEELTTELQSYLDRADPDKVEGDIFAVIAPHAGYRYSGQVAAYGYKAVRGRGIKSVILIGFTHRPKFDGIAIYDRGSFRTPLGDIAVDSVLASRIATGNPRVSYRPDAFSQENSVEMEVPFIQMALKGSKIVPIAFGAGSFKDVEELAGSLERALRGRDDYLIVASTDLSHYRSYDDANRIDGHLMKVLDGMDPKELYEEAALGTSELCGVMPVATAIMAAKKLGYDKIKVLKYANSGDTAGDKSRVVGYLSAVIYKSTETGGEKLMMNDAQRKRLLQIARESISSYVGSGKKKAFTEEDPALNQEMGAFVTLHERGELRGCIGNLTAQGPLYRTVASMAIEAATADPRFPALTRDEVDKVDIEISVLSPMKKVASADEVKVPGDGVVIKRGLRSGVFLPQVADETGWNREEFLSNLCAHKAGLLPDAWKDPGTEIYVFTAEVFGEKPEPGSGKKGPR